MVKISNSLEGFFNEVKTNEQIKKMKIYDVLVSNCDEFYHVCEKFADIGLNAPKYRVPGTCNVQGYFQFEDIQKAKESAKNFYIEKDIHDVNEYLSAIENVYAYAVDFRDTRCRSALVKPQNADFSSGFYGKYHNFVEVPNDIWSDIMEETKQYIMNS